MQRRLSALGCGPVGAVAVSVSYGVYEYVELIHFVIKQKLTHHCKAIILNKDVFKKSINVSFVMLMR